MEWNENKMLFCKPNDKNFKNYKVRILKFMKNGHNSYIKFKKWRLKMDIKRFTYTQKR